MKETRTLEVERSTSTAHRLRHYNGVCGNIHGHNMQWQVEVEVSMDDVGESNMPLDLKTISSAIDRVDHATILNENDPLVHDMRNSHEGIHTMDGARDFIERSFGEVYWMDGDPTCEVLAKQMAEEIYERADAIMHVFVEVAETDKYSISAMYNEFGQE